MAALPVVRDKPNKCAQQSEAHGVHVTQDDFERDRAAHLSTSESSW